jgi:Zinc knuckle
MSLSKPVKEAAVPRTEERGRGRKFNFSLRTKFDELQEIKHNSWLDWDDMMLGLQEFLWCNFLDLESIIPDPMRLLDIAGYIQYIMPILRPEELADIKEANDPLFIRKQTVLLLFRAKIASHMQKTEKQMLDRASAYRVVSSMCSPQLNAILVVDPTFIAVGTNDPLALLAAIKSVVTSKCDGNIELERTQALRDWYTPTMRECEDVVDYRRRSVKLCERLTSTGVPEPQRPRLKEQSLRFINGLSSSISTYLDYKNYISNSLAVTGVDIYPATLVAAINSVTKFHLGTKAAQPMNPSGITYMALAALEGEKPKGKPRAGRDKKSKSDKDKPTSDSTPGGEKDKDVKCHNCGKLGHIKRECRGKKKDKVDNLLISPVCCKMVSIKNSK